VAGAAKEMAVAYRYGISPEVDAYLFVFGLASWPIGVWLSVLSIVLVPLAGRIAQCERKEMALFRSELLGLSLLLSCLAAVLVWVGLTTCLRSGWAGLPPQAATIADTMSQTLAWLPAIGVIIGLFSAWTLSAGRHTNTLLEAVPAVVLLVCVLSMPGGTEPLVWGTLIGFGVHAACLLTSLLRRREIEAPRFSRLSRHWPAFWQGFGVMLLAQATMSLVQVADQVVAARLDSGSIATLGYSNRIVSLVLGIGATAVGRAALPIFANAHVIDRQELYITAMRWVRGLFALGVVAMIVGVCLAPAAVSMLFERGKFGQDDTQAVVVVLRYGLLQVPFYFAGLVLVSLLAGCGKHKWIALGACANVLVKIAATIALVPTMGVCGITLATGAMYATSFFLLWRFSAMSVANGSSI